VRKKKKNKKKKNQTPQTTPNKTHKKKPQPQPPPTKPQLFVGVQKKGEGRKEGFVGSYFTHGYITYALGKGKKRGRYFWRKEEAHGFRKITNNRKSSTYHNARLYGKGRIEEGTCRLVLSHQTRGGTRNKKKEGKWKTTSTRPYHAI